MLEMRIVGLSESTGTITLQHRRTKGRWTTNWYQDSYTYYGFVEYMKRHFPKYFNFYEIAMEQQKYYEFAAEWFYNFGETLEMIRSGELYIFTN